MSVNYQGTNENLKYQTRKYIDIDICIFTLKFSLTKPKITKNITAYLPNSHSKLAPHILSKTSKPTIYAMRYKVVVTWSLL